MKSKFGISVAIIFLIVATGFTVLATGFASAAETSIITIDTDGSITPSTAPISISGSEYTVTANIVGALRVYKSDIILDGAGYTLEAPADETEAIVGIKLYKVENTTIMNFKITGFTDFGIYLKHSDEITVKDNHLFENDVGIQFEYADDNIIQCNTITNNTLKGMYFRESNDNLITGNDVIDNKYALYFHSSTSGNTIHHNNFEKFIEFGDKGTDNTWDDGNGEGNFWDNYDGADDGTGGRTANDGVGDTDIPHLDADSYPLMERASQCDEDEDDDPCEKTCRIRCYFRHTRMNRYRWYKLNSLVKKSDRCFRYAKYYENSDSSYMSRCYERWGNFFMKIFNYLLNCYMRYNYIHDSEGHYMLKIGREVTCS